METPISHGDEKRKRKPCPPRFSAATAPREWAAHGTLARLCEDARLSPIQAELMRLRTEGVSWTAMPEALGVDKRRMYGIHKQACAKMDGAARRYTTRSHRDLLECFENVRLQGKGQAHVTCEERRERPRVDL